MRIDARIQDRKVERSAAIDSILLRVQLAHHRDVTYMHFDQALTCRWISAMPAQLSSLCVNSSYLCRI